MAACICRMDPALTSSRYLVQLFLRGLPHLTKHMPAPKKVFRHLKQDPDFEPDFDALELIAPLPSDIRFGTPLTVEDILKFCREKGRNERRVLEKLQALLLTGGDDILLRKMEEARRNSHGA